MSTVFVNLGMSLDGFIAGPNRGPRNPLGDRGRSLHDWLFAQRAFRRSLKLGDDGETGPDNDMVEKTLGRIGANIMGKRMFEEGEANWPQEAPFLRWPRRRASVPERGSGRGARDCARTGLSR